MSRVKDRIAGAYRWAAANRPKVNGYPFLAEALRQAGVTRYVYSLPSCQCVFFTEEGPVASQTEGLAPGMSDVPRFDREAFIEVLRTSQRGDSSFPEFLRGSWETGIIGYEADLVERRVTYHGAGGESYVEDYPEVEVKM